VSSYSGVSQHLLSWWRRLSMYW